MNEIGLNETEWIKTFGDDGKELHFEVPSDWLWKTLKEWAGNDAEDVKNEKETYIEGRTKHLYEHLEDEHFANTIYDLACEYEIILATK